MIKKYFLFFALVSCQQKVTLYNSDGEKIASYYSSNKKEALVECSRGNRLYNSKCNYDSTPIICNHEDTYGVSKFHCE
jgi:hypothetical protein